MRISWQPNQTGGDQDLAKDFLTQLWLRLKSPSALRDAVAFCFPIGDMRGGVHFSARPNTKALAVNNHHRKQVNHLHERQRNLKTAYHDISASCGHKEHAKYDTYTP
jgi:hypothetical protein